MGNIQEKVIGEEEGAGAKKKKGGGFKMKMQRLNKRTKESRAQQVPHIFDRIRKCFGKRLIEKNMSTNENIKDG